MMENNTVDINPNFEGNHLDIPGLTISSYLDASKFRCPMPLAKTKKQLKTLNPDQTLLVKTTDPSFLIDIKVFAKKSGNHILQIFENNNATFTLIQKA